MHQVESRLTDINPPILLTSLTSGKYEDRLHLRPDVSEALGVALNTLRQIGGTVPDGLTAYYLNDSEGFITHLEIRDLTKAVAQAIYRTLVQEGLGGFIALSEKNGTVGLPNPVNRFKLIPVIEVRGSSQPHSVISDVKPDCLLSSK